MESCPINNIIPNYDAYRGSHEVTIKELALCSKCSQPCKEVCPSIRIDYGELVQSLHQQQLIDRRGVVKSIKTGYSPAFQNNGISSSGGVIRLLIHHYITKEIPVVTLTGLNGKYFPETITRVEDLAKVPGSIYHSVSFTPFISEIRNCPDKCVLVATPCQLEGFFLYATQFEPSLLKKIELTLGLICGWMFSDHMIKAFSSFKKIKDPVINTTYRGEDKTGCLKLQTANHTYSYHRRIFPNTKSRIDYSSSCSSASNRLRCRLCENHINILADISIGDAWLRRFPEEKLSLLVTRSEKGEELITSLTLKNELILANGFPSDIVESQSENLAYGIDARLFKAYLAMNKQLISECIFPDDNQSAMLPDKKDQQCYRIEWHLRSMLRNCDYWNFRNMYWDFNLSKATIGRKPLTLKDRNPHSHYRSKEELQ